MEIDSIREVWQAQPAALASLTSTLVRRKAKVQAWRVWCSAFVDIIGTAAFATALLATALVSETWLCRIGCAMAGVGYWYTAYRMFRATRFRLGSGAKDLLSCITSYRANLESLRARNATVLWWLILPSAPGVALALFGWLISSPGEWANVAKVTAFWVSINVIVWTINSRAAAQLQDEIRLLDAVEGQRA